MPSRNPATLWLVRHGESAAMLATRAAIDTGAHRTRLNSRDMDTGLSPTGTVQAAALGHWFAGQAAEARPEILLSSPYARAYDTALGFAAVGGMAVEGDPITDERLRERELGILDGLTWAGVAALHPEQAAQRSLLGKFYHRPPGGENWCDVIQRMRGVLDRIALHFAGRRVMIVAHECVIFCLRYVIEEMDEAQILAIDAAGDVANCGLTEYRAEGAALKLTRWNDTEPLASAPVTRARDPIVGVRG